MPIIQINNKKVHYLEMNNEAKQTVVMLHGMFANSAVFYFKSAPELAKYYRVLLLDFKSHGLSETSETGYDLETMSEDVIAFVDAMQVTNFHLVGYSFGGLVSLNMATSYADRIQKLAIIEAPDPSHSNTRTMLEEHGRDYTKKYFEHYSTETNLSPSKRQLEKSEKLFEFLFSKSSALDDLISDSNFFKEAPLSAIDKDTLLLYGDESDCVPTANFLHNTIKNSTLFIGKGTHAIPVQDPTWIANRLTEFLTK